MLWFKRKPSATLYREPTAEERAALEDERRRQMYEDILRDGGGVLSPYTNVWPGTWGDAVLTLERAGLLEKHVKRGIVPSEDSYVYSLTVDGRAAIARLS